MKKNTWFVTGGAGFIGSHLILKLLEFNIKVICVDISSKNISAMKIWLKKNIANNKIKNLTIYKKDISNFNSISKIIKKHKFSILVNLAAISSISEATHKPQKLFEINVLGFLNLLENINTKITKKIIYASSSSVYGKFSNKSNTENQDLFPISRYGMSKLLNEKIAEIYGITKKINIVGLRFFNIYGERQIFKGNVSGVIPKWIDALKKNKEIIIHNNKNISRDFCYIDDVISAIISCSKLNINQKNANIFNIGYGKSIGVYRLFNLIKKMTKSKNFAVKFDKVSSESIIESGASISKAKIQLKYRPRFDIVSGLKNLLN
jgi:UDP-N-acetylglucosamine 4-epimerase